MMNITWKDLLEILEPYRKSLYRSAYVGGFLGVLLSGFYPLQWCSQASFRELKPRNTLSSASIGLLGVQNLSTPRLMTSSALLKESICDYGLQVEVYPILPYRWLRNLRDQVLGECHWWQSIPQWEFPLLRKTLWATDVSYSQPLARKFEIHRLSSSEYRVLEEENEVGRGKWGELSTFPFGSWKLHADLEHSSDGEKWRVRCLPFPILLEQCRAALSIIPDREDRTILYVTLKWPQLALSQEVLNSILKRYQRWLEQEQRSAFQKQSQYLVERQEIVLQEIQDLLSASAAHRKEALQSHGVRGLYDEGSKALSAQVELEERASQLSLEEQKLSRGTTIELLARKESMERERARLYHLIELRKQEIATLLPQWAADRSLEFQLISVSRASDLLRQLSEQAGAQEILESSQSYPLDLAESPIRSSPPWLLARLLLGALIFVMLTACGWLYRRLKKGVPATHSLLRRLECQVTSSNPHSSSPLHEALEEFLQLRFAKRVLFCGFSTREEVESLLLKQSLLTDALCIDCQAQPTSWKGLQETLHRKCSQSFCWVASYEGCSSESSPATWEQALLMLKEEDYKMCVLWIKASLSHPQARALARICDSVVMRVQDEILEELPLKDPNILYIC